MNDFIKAALIRALRTVCQTLAGALPVGFVITPTMVQDANWSMVYVVIAWLATGALAGLASILTSIYTGLPEVGVSPHEDGTEE